MYSDIYWLIYFKLGVVIETAKVYSLIPVGITLTFIQGQSWVVKQKILHNCFCKYFNLFGMLYWPVDTVQAHAIFFPPWLMFKERTLLIWLWKENVKDNDRNAIFLQFPHCAANCPQHAQVIRTQSCANYIQHIECLSFAKCCVPRGMNGQLT